MASAKVGAQRQAFLSDSQRKEANGSPDGSMRHGRRSEFARRAVEIGRGITATTAKLQRLAECELGFIFVYNYLTSATSGQAENAVR